jgi:hypothetical protein
MPRLLLNEETAKLDHFGRCPSCNASWDAGNIFDVLRPQEWCKDKSDEELDAYIKMAYAPPYKFSRIVGVQLPYTHPDHYDGVSYWQCPYCRHQWERFNKDAT